MARRTRSSRMFRLRNCASTIERRSVAQSGINLCSQFYDSYLGAAGSIRLYRRTGRGLLLLWASKEFADTRDEGGDTVAELLFGSLGAGGFGADYVVGGM